METNQFKAIWISFMRYIYIYFPGFCVVCLSLLVGWYYWNMSFSLKSGVIRIPKKSFFIFFVASFKSIINSNGYPIIQCHLGNNSIHTRVTLSRVVIIKLKSLSELPNSAIRGWEKTSKTLELGLCPTSALNQSPSLQAPGQNPPK